MVVLYLENGKKGRSDTVIKVFSHGEILSFSELLFLLNHYFESENGYYPKPKYEGSTMLMKAILEIYSGIPFDVVIRKYGLNRKGKKLNVVDKRKPQPSVKSIENLHEVLGHE